MTDKRGHPFKVLSAVTGVTGVLSRFELLLLVTVICGDYYWLWGGQVSLRKRSHTQEVS